MYHRKLNLIVWCSETEGRASLREVTFTDRELMITSVERLPPGYEIVIDRMRDPAEEVRQMSTRLKYAPGCQHCPFCNNSLFYICSCGAMSCISPDKKVHSCPICRGVFNLRPADYFFASPSGFGPGGSNALSLPPGSPISQRVLPPPSQMWLPPAPHFVDRRTPEEKAREAAGRRKVRAFLLNGGGQRALPPATPPPEPAPDSGPRALPPGDPAPRALPPPRLLALPPAEQTIDVEAEEVPEFDFTDIWNTPEAEPKNEPEREAEKKGRAAIRAFLKKNK